MSYLKDREIWLSEVPSGNPPAGYFWTFVDNGVLVVRNSAGVNKVMATTAGSIATATTASYVQYSNVANKPAGIVSSSVQVRGYSVFATTGSNQFKSSQAITGSLTVTGQVIAQTLNVQQVTSSIVYSSGSNRFGNSLSNRQQFTGSLSVTGSLGVNSSITVTGDGSTNMFRAVRSGTTRVVVKNGVNTLGINTDTINNPLTVNGGADFSGNVGINVTTPAAELQVGKSSDVTIAMSNSSSVTSGARGSLAWYNSSVSSVATIRAAAVTDNVGTELQFFTRPAAGSLTQVLTLASTGAATFSSSVTATLLKANDGVIQLFRAGSFRGGLYTLDAAIGSGTDYSPTLTSENDINFLTGGSVTKKVTITAAGNVGIGTASPGGFLELSSANSNNVQMLLVRNYATSATGNFTGIYTAEVRGASANNIRHAMNIHLNENASDRRILDVTSLAGTVASFISNGNVGIGTTTPVAALNVSNVPSSFYGIIETTGTSAGTVKHFRVHKPGYVEYGIGILADNSFHISTASTFPTSNGFTMTSGGDVGINKTTPDANSRLDVNGQAFVAHLAIYNNNGTPTLGTSPMLYSPASGTLAISTNASERMRINSSGNIGIGTTSPNGRLTIKAEVSDTPSLIFRNEVGGPHSAISNYVSAAQTYTVLGTNVYVNSTANLSRFETNRESSGVICDEGLLRFVTGPTSSGPSARMNINSSGNIGIGTTNITGRLVVTADDSQYVLRSQNASASNQNQFYIQHSLGNVTIGNDRGTVTYGNSSDYRLKEDLKDYNGLNIINQLKTYNFKWKESGIEDFGVIAHEMQEVLPNYVTREKDELNEDGSIKAQSVDYTKLVPILVKAVQELKSENDNLKSRLEVLEQA